MFYIFAELTFTRLQEARKYVEFVICLKEILFTKSVGLVHEGTASRHYLNVTDTKNSFSCTS